MRKARALIIVSLLGAMPIAAADQYLSMTDGGVAANIHSATGVELVEQHTVFRELIQTKVDKFDNQIFDNFGAVVGLVKVCQKNRQQRVFDNAVLWFNDQFLFGEKRNQRNESRNVTGFRIMGNNTGVKTDRWIGCIVPNGFAVLTKQETTRAQLETAINTDHMNGGLTFSYKSSFFITDPNNVRWIIDRYRFGGTDIWITHLQVDFDGEPYQDTAPWRWGDANGNDQIRDGAPRYEGTNEETGGSVEDCRTDPRCALEYNFLLPVEFAKIEGPATNASTGVPHPPNQESKAGNSHPNNPTSAENGGPCPGDQEANEVPGGHRCASDVGAASEAPIGSHPHPTVTVNVFFLHKGPFDLETNRRYWGPWAPRGGLDPAIVPNFDCSGHPVLDSRRWRICDVIADSGFHLHDGSQTISRTVS